MDVYMNDEKFQDFQREGMHFIHLNVRSLLPKISEVRINAQKSNASIIGICETWLDSSVKDYNVNIKGYTLIRNDRKNKHGGGVCMYISNDIYINPLELDVNDIETVWVEVYLPNSKPFIVGTVYRPPNDKDFLYHFEKCLVCLRNFNLELVILGDFNICMNKKKDSLCIDYKRILNSFKLKQLISSPTRITEKSSTLIDHILVQNDKKFDKEGSIIMGLSDHNMVYCTRKISPGQIRKKTVEMRDTQKVDFKVFVKEVKNIEWMSYTRSSSVHKNFKNFHDAFLKVIDRSAPVIPKHKIDPWMLNHDIPKLLSERDRLFRRKKRDWKKISKVKKSLEKVIKKSRSEYIFKTIEENKDNPQKLKQQFKDLGFLNQTRVEPQKAMYINERICQDNKKIANHFNTYFSTFASKLVSALPTANGKYNVESDCFMNFYSKRNSKNHTLNNLGQVHENFVFDEFCDVYMKKNSCLDEIPEDLKSVANKLKEPMTSIINHSIESGIVPKCMKQIRVKPLPKKKSSFQEDGTLDVENYIPVCIDSGNVISMICERHVVRQLEHFLHTNSMLYELQSGFRSGFSSDTCLINLLDHIRVNSSNKLLTGMLLLNLQQAFNTVDYTILGKKLNKMGIHSPWVKSYVMGRAQLVDCGGVLSKLMNSTQGLSEESILDRLLFLCYVNDLPISIDTDCKLILYGDKIAIIFSNKKLDKISKKLSKQFDQCSEWLKENKLMLKKTEYILFGPKRKLKRKQKRKSQFKVRCHHVDIKARKRVKFLGITIDKFLKFDHLVNEIVAKVNTRLKFLKRKGNELNIESRLTLASALIEPCFYRCSSAWYESLSKPLKNKLQAVQDETIRYIKGLKSTTSINCHILDSINTLGLTDKVRQFRLEHAHNIIYGFAPKYLQEHFDRKENNTEWALNRNLPVPKVWADNRSNFSYNAISNWNSLPLEVKLTKDRASFISQVKLHLAKQARVREGITPLLLLSFVIVVIIYKTVHRSI